MREWEPDGPLGKPYRDPLWVEKNREVSEARKELNACERSL
jgi:hypothetical protein